MKGNTDKKLEFSNTLISQNLACYIQDHPSLCETMRIYLFGGHATLPQDYHSLSKHFSLATMVLDDFIPLWE